MGEPCNITAAETEVTRFALTPVVMTTCILSIIGTLVIISTYIVWKNNRTRLRQMLMILSVADLLVALGNFYGVMLSSPDETNYDVINCKIQSAITTFASLNSFFWSIHMAIYLYFILVRTSVGNAEKLIPFFHVTAFGVPGLIVAAAIGWDVLGRDYSYFSGGWCWIEISNPCQPISIKAASWMLLTGKAWEMIAYIVVPVLYITIKVHMQKQIRLHVSNHGSQSLPSDHVMVRMQFKLILIPLVFICLRVWGTIKFLLLMVAPRPQDIHPATLIALSVMQGIGDSGQGIANCILFCFLTKHVRLRMWLACRTCRLYCCWCTWKSPRHVKMRNMSIDAERTRLLEEQDT